MTQTDFNTRYGDATPITGEVLEGLGFVRDGYGWHRIASTCGRGRQRRTRWQGTSRHRSKAAGRGGRIEYARPKD